MSHALTARFAVARQSSQGAPAGDGFISPRLRSSELSPCFTALEPGAEHFHAAPLRPTLRRAAAPAIGHHARFAGSGLLYPDSLGLLLCGAGFQCATAGAGPARTHMFTVAAPEGAAWLTVMQRIGEGAAAFERKAADAKVTEIALDIDGNEGARLAFAGLALGEGPAGGGEGVTAETAAPLLAVGGSVTVTLGGAALSGPVRALGLRIAHPARLGDGGLLTLAHGDLPSLGVDVSGVLGGLDVEADTYRRLVWGGPLGRAPAALPAEIGVAFTLVSAAPVAPGGPPYSLHVSVPLAEARLGAFRAAGAELIRCDVGWRMVDAAAAAPVTITLVNSVEGYA